MHIKSIALLVCLVTLAFAAPAPNKDFKYVVTKSASNDYHIKGALNECFYGDVKIVECTSGENYITEPCEGTTGAVKSSLVVCTECICDYTLENGFILVNYGKSAETCVEENKDWYISKLDTCTEIYGPLYGKYSKTEDDKIKVAYHESDTTCAETPTGETTVEDGACILEDGIAIKVYLSDKILEGDDGSVANLIASGLIIIGTLLIAA